MASNTTATVEVLMAEVRVLMVGSRQITLSVARQLDWVDLTDLEPFGRVKLGGVHPDVAAIGRHRPDGTLALAQIQNDAGVARIPAGHLSPYVVVCSRLDPIWDQHMQTYTYRLLHHGRPFLIARDAVRNCFKEGHQRFVDTGKGPLQCEHIWSATLEALSEIDELIEQALDPTDPHQSAIQLPLIVLAGLR